MGRDVRATEIIEQMAHAYARYGTYRDRGTSTTHFLWSNPRRTMLECKTAFQRPHDFRFEYHEEDGIAPGIENRMIIHRDKSGTRSWWSLQGREDAESLRMALAAATGVSSCTAHTVPSLLMPTEIGGRRFLHDRNWTLLRESEQDGSACYRVSHNVTPEDTEVLWIDKREFLLLRIDRARTTEGRSGRFQTERATLYLPQLDADIPETDLAFNAPGD